MNDELQELEAELQRLIPRAPSEVCKARVEAMLDGRRKSGDRWGRVWRGLAFSGVAAAVALAIGTAKTSPASGALSPIAVENEVCGTHDDGVIKLADGTPAWRTRIEYVDTVRWSGGGRTLTVKAPREEQRIVPLFVY